MPEETGNCNNLDSEKRLIKEDQRHYVVNGQCNIKFAKDLTMRQKSVRDQSLRDAKANFTAASRKDCQKTAIS